MSDQNMEQNELLEPTPPTLGEQIRELERELAVRKEVYPGWIERDKIKLQTANYRIGCIKATIASLERLQAVTGPGAPRPLSPAGTYACAWAPGC